MYQISIDATIVYSAASFIKDASYRKFIYPVVRNIIWFDEFILLRVQKYCRKYLLQIDLIEIKSIAI